MGLAPINMLAEIPPRHQHLYTRLLLTDPRPVMQSVYSVLLQLYSITLQYYYLQPHRDSEKVDGMFGTLVIQLPSDYKGGQLIVNHQGEKKTFDYSNKPWKCYYAAFYADCEHEICEVTEGYRLCLVYNLISRAQVSLALPSTEDNSEAVGQVVETITEWIKDEKSPSVMAYLLDHKYCDASLSFGALKNKDRAVGDLLQNARKQVNFDLYLTNITKEELWFDHNHDNYYDLSYCDGTSDSLKRRGRYHGNDVCDMNLEASSFRSNPTMVTPDGNRVQIHFSELNNLLKELLPTTLDTLPDRAEFEKTGNAGASLDKTYFRAILIIHKKGASLHAQ